MRTTRVEWAAIWTLVLAPAAVVVAHAGCGSVYDELYKPLTAMGGGGGGVG